jgi:hypothetical protein
MSLRLENWGGRRAYQWRKPTFVAATQVDPADLAASSRPTSDTPCALGPGDPDKRLLENAEVLKYGYFL